MGQQQLCNAALMEQCAAGATAAESQEEVTVYDLHASFAMLSGTGKQLRCSAALMEQCAAGRRRPRSQWARTLGQPSRLLPSSAG